MTYTVEGVDSLTLQTPLQEARGVVTQEAVASPPTPLQRARGVVTQAAETAAVTTTTLTRTERGLMSDG